MKLLKSGKIWPYAIGAAITLVFGFCVATIIVTGKADLQKSDAYMTYYQDADANANNYIQAKIMFDKKYKVHYISNGIDKKGSLISYRIVDISGNPVNNAEVILATSRPETNKYNQKLENPEVKDGVYTFKDALFPKVGVWNLIAKVKIGDNFRFLNIKADTRSREAFEF